MNEIVKLSGDDMLTLISLAKTRGDVEISLLMQELCEIYIQNPSAEVTADLRSQADAKIGDRVVSFIDHARNLGVVSIQDAQVWNGSRVFKTEQFFLANPEAPLVIMRELPSSII